MTKEKKKDNVLDFVEYKQRRRVPTWEELTEHQKELYLQGAQDYLAWLKENQDELERTD